MTQLSENMKIARDLISDKVKFTPEIGLVLGSGLGILANEIENPVYVNYSDIPNFPVSTVEGHEGRFVFGKLMGKSVVAMQGRFHFYEGYSMKEITFPIYVMKSLGVKHIILTNAAGGVNKTFMPGDLMIINDQINLTGHSPLIGKNDEALGPRFPDCSNIYDKAFNQKIMAVANKENILIREGVYFYNTGPAYETPAEVKLAGLLGGDAVGMSTAPEALIAAYLGVKVTGISCITNMAAGISDQALNHQEVVETANKVKSTFIKLVKKIIEIA